MMAFNPAALVDSILAETASGEMAWSEPDQNETIRATWRGLSVSLQTKRGAGEAKRTLNVNGLTIKAGEERHFARYDDLVRAMGEGIASKLGRTRETKTRD